MERPTGADRVTWLRIWAVALVVLAFLILFTAPAARGVVAGTAKYVR